MGGVTLSSRDPALEQRLTALLGKDVVFRRVWSDQWHDTVEATMDLCSADPELLVVGADVHLETAKALVVETYRRYPRTAVVVLLPGADMARAVEFWRLGARDVIEVTQSDHDLAQHILGVLEEVRYRRNVASLDDPTRQRRVIVILSPKGGTGKTTVAVNLGVALARRRPNQVLLVDLDTQFGDCAAGLGVEPEHSIAHAIESGSSQVRRSTLKVFLTNHHSGLSLLSAPDDLMTADSLDNDDLKKTLGALVEEFPYVVFDTSAGIDHACIVAMNLATDFLFVSTTDIPAIRAVRRQVEALDRIGYTKQQRTFVLNRANAKVGLSVSDVENAVGMQASFRIRSSRVVPVSTNQGNPIVESSSGNIAKTFNDLAEYYAPGGSA